ncbi:LptF/LptG family permease [Pseudobacter ginsenosidimutans]|uniref:Lipopolysaccharide export system permease protein n=1 Tax=Pseudobacter ginsenosidimutans TaxID=661488 RepID=A0A4Q7MUU6_9BACT|nr:LptF/LptG family permease [Pseudobacter ginsenosidimutans]QEC42280.1 YjgP/YjgQ family permease [Pseudobacter ginsenosidimutans]RZS70873.1 lipopolysaccharide export system permease protein [Pseudobacter ginsenosidimutans]
MKKIDWYIIKKYLSTTIFMVLIFSVIAVVIDTSEKADDFVKSGLSSWQIVTDYYLGFVPFIISMIFPLMVFIAVIFFTSKMAARSEIIAMLASGVRYNRVLAPFMAAALFLGGIFWVATQIWIPKAATIRGNFQTTYIDSKSSYEQGELAKRGNNYYLKVDSVTFAGFREYNNDRQMAYGGFFMDRIKGTQLIYNLRADNIRWDTAKKSWVIENAIERHIDGIKESIKKIDTMKLALNVKPTEIKPDKYLKDKLTTSELKAFIQAEANRGTEGLNDFKVERYRRDATPFSVLVLTLIGFSVAARKTRGGSGLNLAVGIITAAIFVVMDKFSLTFSTKSNFPPILAAWTPNIIFTCIAIWLHKKAPK